MAKEVCKSCGCESSRIRDFIVYGYGTDEEISVRLCFRCFSNSMNNSTILRGFVGQLAFAFSKQGLDFAEMEDIEVFESLRKAFEK